MVLQEVHWEKPNLQGKLQKKTFIEYKEMFTLHQNNDVLQYVNFMEKDILTLCTKSYMYVEFFLTVETKNLNITSTDEFVHKSVISQTHAQSFSMKKNSSPINSRANL